MSTAQMLLRRLLEQAGGPSDDGYLLAMDGPGMQDLPPEIATARGTHAVHRVGTEIGLRHLLWNARGAPVIGVVPPDLAGRLPVDLIRRARNNRIHALATTDVLEVVLGVRVVGADAPHLQQLALEHVGELQNALSQRTLPTVVDRRLLLELLLDASVGERVRLSSAADLLAGWILRPPTWTPAVKQLVCDALPVMHADEGRLLAWALAEPDRLEALVIHGAVLSVSDAELPKPVWGPLWKAAEQPPIELDRRIVRRTAVRLVEQALASLGEAASGLLAKADSLGREKMLPAQLATSRILPLAFADRCHALAKEAAAGKAVSAQDVAWLRGHLAAGVSKAELEVLEGIARLSRYLDRPWSPSVAIDASVADYLTDGAFADLTSARLRRALAGTAKLHVEAQAVLSAVRARRDLENEHFAKSLAAGYEAALHSAGVTPLHRTWKRLVAPVLQQDPNAKLYLVVLDGCSVAVFLELLYALAQDRGFPVGMRPDEVGVVRSLSALAPLPTVTSHARGALFLGELPQDPLVAETVFRDQDETRTDKARFTQNAAIDGRERRLFLKGDLADGGQALLTALADDDIAVVAAVFNAVDDQIGSSNTGAAVRLQPEEILAFKPSLKAALDAGRRILLTADHGHSPFVSKDLRVGAGSTPRFTTLGTGDLVPEGFLEIDVKGLGGPPARRAFAWRSGVYLGSPQVGFHGGCSLEEMVVPMAWLVRDGLPANEPAWWHGGGALEVESTPMRVLPPIVTPVPSVPPAKAGQYGLFDPASKIDLLSLPADLVEKLSKDERTVLVLLFENQSARASDLAVRLGKNPGRLNGLMRTLRRTLFREGITFFSDETLPSGETLYRYAGEGNRS